MNFKKFRLSFLLLFSFSAATWAIDSVPPTTSPASEDPPQKTPLVLYTDSGEMMPDYYEKLQTMVDWVEQHPKARFKIDLGKGDVRTIGPFLGRGGVTAVFALNDTKVIRLPFVDTQSERMSRIPSLLMMRASFRGQDALEAGGAIDKFAAAIHRNQSDPNRFLISERIQTGFTLQDYMFQTKKYAAPESLTEAAVKEKALEFFRKTAHFAEIGDMKPDQIAWDKENKSFVLLDWSEQTRLAHSTADISIAPFKGYGLTERSKQLNAEFASEIQRHRSTNASFNTQVTILENRTSQLESIYLPKLRQAVAQGPEKLMNLVDEILRLSSRDRELILKNENFEAPLKTLLTQTPHSDPALLPRLTTLLKIDSVALSDSTFTALQDASTSTNRSEKKAIQKVLAQGVLSNNPEIRDYALFLASEKLRLALPGAQTKLIELLVSGDAGAQSNAKNILWMNALADAMPFEDSQKIALLGSFEWRAEWEKKYPPEVYRELVQTPQGRLAVIAAHGHEDLSRAALTALKYLPESPSPVVRTSINFARLRAPPNTADDDGLVIEFNPCKESF